MQQHNFASFNKSKGASLSSDDKVYEISQTHLRKKANKEDDTTQSPKLQLSKSKDASSSSKEEESPLKKNVKKNYHKPMLQVTSIQEVKRCIFVIK